METRSVEPNDRFKTVTELFIALVALVIALAAWRSAVSARAAGFEDYYALIATLNDQDTQVVNAANAYQHYSAFTSYTVNATLYSLLAQDQENAESEDDQLALALQMEETNQLAKTNQNFFPARMVDRQGDYNLQREITEQYADAKRRSDLDAPPHLAKSDGYDAKTFGMIELTVLLGVALLCYSLAGAFHPERKLARYTSFGLGCASLIASLVSMFITEFR